MQEGQGHHVIAGRFVIRAPYRRGRIWVAEVRDRRTGGRRKVSSGQTAKRAGMQAIIEEVERWARGDEKQTQPVSFERAAREWLSLKTVCKSTEADLVAALQGVFLPAFSWADVNLIQLADVEVFLKGMADKGRAARTRQKHLGTLRGSSGGQCAAATRTTIRRRESRWAGRRAGQAWP